MDLKLGLNLGYWGIGPRGDEAVGNGYGPDLVPAGSCPPPGKG